MLQVKYSVKLRTFKSFVAKMLYLIEASLLFVQGIGEEEHTKLNYAGQPYGQRTLCYMM